MTAPVNIKVIYGPMFAGKSTHLLELGSNHISLGIKFIIIVSSLDNRYYVGYACSHNGHKLKAIIATNLMDVFEQTADVDVVFIDEGQFFADLVEFCRACNARFQRVIVAGLDLTAERKPFGGMPALIDIASEKLHLYSNCYRCGNQAEFTKLKKNKVKTGDILVGTGDLYVPSCQACLTE